MKNGAVKHSKDLVESDLSGEKKLAEKMNKMRGANNYVAPTLAHFQAEPGFYIDFKGRLIGPFADATQATEAHREWMWESKHG